MKLNKDTIIPPYAEEQTINQKIEQIEETLGQFKQLIPTNFIQIETDYLFTTKSKWTKSLSERYSFEHERERYQVDIPHTILESLELEKKTEITKPLYLDPQVLKREPTCGGITIDNKDEIFLFLPASKSVREIGTQTKLSIKEITELERGLKELNAKYRQLRLGASNILYSEATIPALEDISDEYLIAQAQEVMDKLSNRRAIDIFFWITELYFSF